MYNSFDFICDKAEKLKVKYDETNPLKLARGMGIKVLYAAMGKSIESCKGFYLTHSRIRTIEKHDFEFSIFETACEAIRFKG